LSKKMAKLAEKLTILLETGNGFLIRLYNTKIKYMPESKDRPSFLSDPVYAKVVVNFAKKFPEIPNDLDKVLATVNCRFSKWGRPFNAHFCDLIPRPMGPSVDSWLRGVLEQGEADL
jgi:hypothetical protein